MIVITGAAGFIGSNLCRKLNLHSINKIILVDDFTQKKKQQNWENIEYADKIEREPFFKWAEQYAQYIDFIFHLGARTDYYSNSFDVFESLNIDFSQRLWSFATAKGIPFIYASSYLANDTRKLSAFAKSKYIFDKWIEKQRKTPPFWAGLKFFQVYGSNEAHKAENASNVFKFFQYYLNNEAALYPKSNIIQDYIYVNDAVKVLYYFLNHLPKSGLYEVGTGFARPLSAVVEAIHKRGNKKPHAAPSGLFGITKDLFAHEPIVFQSDLTLLRKYAYKQPFLTLEEGVKRIF